MSRPAIVAILRLDTEDAGFTITEILVTITAGSLVIGFALSLFLFTGKLVSRWQKETELKDQVRGVVVTVVRDLDRSLQAQSADDSTWVVTLPSGKEVIYRTSAGTVYRNNVVLAGEKEVSFRLVVTPLSSAFSSSGSTREFHVQAEGTRRGRTERASGTAFIPASSKLRFAGQ